MAVAASFLSQSVSVSVHIEFPRNSTQQWLQAM